MNRMNSKTFDWLGQTIGDLARLKEIDAEKSNSLSIYSDQDFPASLDNVKSVHISYKYEGKQIISLIERVLSQAQLSRLSIMYSVKWADICSLDLSGIEELAISLEGELTADTIGTNSLRKLEMFGEKDVINGEMLNLSTISMLESLSIHRIMGFDPWQIVSLSGLKKLDIQDSGISNLEWLKDASYQLENLCIIDPIFDCSGIEAQKSIIKLTIGHCVMMDATPIAELHHLKHLDIRNGSFFGGEGLRKLGIDELFLNRQDVDSHRLKASASGLTYWAAMRIRNQNKNYSNQEYMSNLNPFQRRRALRLLELPIEQRIMEAIEQEYKHHIRVVSESKYPRLASYSNEEYIRAFKTEAERLFPFITEN